MRKPFNTPQPFAILHPAAEAPANPPFVNWFPHPDAARYRVTFEGRAANEAWETPRNFLTPPTALPPGTYRVLVEALAADGPVLATAECETRLGEPRTGVTADLNALEKRPGSKVFLSDADVAAINAATGDRGQWRDALLAAADKVDEALFRAAEPKPYPDGVWNFATWKDNNALCIAIEDALFAATTAWRLTGDAKYMEPAVALIRNAVQWDPTGVTGVWENDHSAHALLHSFAVAYDTFGDALPSDLRDALRRNIAARCRDIYAFQNPFHKKELSCGLMGDPSNNHAWFVAEAMGIGGLALWDAESDARDWVALAAQLHPGAFFPYGDPDGGWHEGIDYWSYGLSFTFQFLDALLDTTGVNLYEHPWLKRTTTFKLLAHPPAGGYVPFGDVKHRRPVAVDRLIAMRLASRTGDPLAWRYVDALAGEGIDQPRYLPHALAWSERGGVTPEAAAAAEPPRVAHYREMGWVVANSDAFGDDGQVLFAFKSGGKHPEAMGHCHADVNSFVLCAGGDKLLWDGGYYDSYGSPHHIGYSRNSEAHNVLLLDGAGQLVHARGVYGRITRFENSGDDVLVESDASHPLVYGARLARYIRRARLSGWSSLVIEDDILARDTVTMSLLLHSAYPIVYDPGAKTIRIKGPRYVLEGRLETDEPVNAVITTAFEQPPNLSSHLLDTFNEYPEQCRLELRTARKLTGWQPRVTFAWRRL